MRSGVRNAMGLLLLLPLIYILIVIGILPPYADTPQVYWGLSFIIIIFAYAQYQFTSFSGIMSHRQAAGLYEPADPSLYTRAVRDGRDGAEYLISGAKTTLFRKACLDNWQFVKVDKKSNWTIVDERGNDVSNEPMSRFDGVFTLIGSYTQDEPSDESDEYSSIHDSVEYYD
ncbi:MAG: hypothetical protein ACW98U_14205 [Candidatus Thorarchaeota archaeon]